MQARTRLMFMVRAALVEPEVSITSLDEEGEIEVDNDARVSIGEDDGAYVAAWVWVPLKKEKANSQVQGHRPMTRSTRP
jgi:hypothetical protein